MANLGIFKTFDAEGEIAPYRICAHGSKDYAVKQATAKTDALLGTTDELGRQPNNRVDVCLDKMPEVEAGGTLAAGDRLIGFALTSASAGDIITYIHAPGTLGVAASPAA